MQITKGKLTSPQKVVVYGVEGIGKTTLAAGFPNPVFMDVEGSSGHLDVSRIDAPTGWRMLLAELDEFVKSNQGFDTLVVDSADWTEALAKREICEAAKVAAIGDVSYGVLYQRLAGQWGVFLGKLTEISKHMNVVLTCHAQLYKFEQPDEIGQYDRWTLKLQASFKVDLCAMTKEWADMLLFCNFKTFVVKTDTKAKAQGGERVMYASHHPAWDAKNRHGLPDEMPLEFAAIAHCIPTIHETKKQQEQKPAEQETSKKEPAKEDVQKADQSQQNKEAKIDESAFNHQVYDLMIINGITDDEMNAYLYRKGFFKVNGMTYHNLGADVVGQMVMPQNWERVINNINENRAK